LKITLFKKEGVKGMLPLGCLPLWGREGVILIVAAENYRMTLKKRVSTEPGEIKRWGQNASCFPAYDNRRHPNKGFFCAKV
jgi:hypothetical protein